MGCKLNHFSISNKKGFTLIELLVVVAILGVLATIGLTYFQVSREKSYDAQVVSIVRNLLTYAAVDEPIGEQDSTVADPSDLTPVGYDKLKVGNRIEYQIVNADGTGADPKDAWQFWFAHPSGRTGYYFWVPGDACTGTKDGLGFSSDAIQEDPAFRVVVGL